MLRGLSRTALFSFAALVLCARGIAHAQAPSAGDSAARSWTLRVDNDALDLWEPVWDRPDEDYSSGVRIVYDNAWMPWWARNAWAKTPRCTGLLTICRTTRAWIGQDIYTAERFPNESLMTVGARPSAGWLYYGEELRRVTPGVTQLLDLTLGVTGPPSFGAQTQEIAHSFVPDYHRPIDWSHQIGFQPGVIATYEWDKLMTLASVGPLAAQVIPSATATAGNISDQASTTFEARLGWRMRNPWLPPAFDSPLEIDVTGAETEFAVARDLFLDGSSGLGRPIVGHLPFYLEQQLGISVAYRRVRLGYRGVFDAKTYSTGRAHAWGSLVGTFTR